MGPQQTPRSPQIWSREAVDAIVKAADAAGNHSIGTAVLLNEWLGQRPADLLSAQQHEIVDGTLTIRQRKTDARVALPIGIVPQLVTRIAAERHRQRQVVSPYLIVCEETSRPYTVDSFSRAFAELRKAAAATANNEKLAAELATLTFRTLRHTAVTRLADAEVDIPGIAAITGHSLQAVTNILEHYLVRTAEQARRAFRRRLTADRSRDARDKKHSRNDSGRKA